MDASRWLIAGMLSVALAGAAWSADELAPRASWTVPATAQVKAALDDYLTALGADEALRASIAPLWPDEALALEGADLLERLAASLALVDPQYKAIVDHCQMAHTVGLPPEFAVLKDEAAPPLIRNNLRLLYGRWLAQNELMDEAVEQLQGLHPADVVDPASLLFHQALAHHRLLEKEPCLAAVTRLMENENEIPKRYATVARLMEADLKPLKTDSLDEISRLMADVGRRLTLARAGKKVRDEEEEIIKKLEKMIEEMEQQQQQQQQQASSGSPRPSSPLQDSRTPSMRGKGEVDQKNIGKKDGWGNLPPKDRQEVLQQIGRELPAHFRETIEEYFKRLAQDGVK
ncbi:MAG TPA: hypothetical protein VMP01_22285 [Pirellulaceae bacterium]|nr:hypothetical protein [Pirellulaceae bacterium]